MFCTVTLSVDLSEVVSWEIGDTNNTTVLSMPCSSARKEEMDVMKEKDKHSLPCSVDLGSTSIYEERQGQHEQALCASINTHIL